MKTIDTTKLVPIDAPSMKMGELVFKWYSGMPAPEEGVFLEYKPDRPDAYQARCWFRDNPDTDVYTIDGRVVTGTAQIIFRGPIPWKEMTYRVGQRFRHVSGREFLLCYIGRGWVALVDLKTGVRWTANPKVADVGAITEAEFSDITAGRASEFTLIES